MTATRTHLATGAALVIIALTAAAFWLSYAHLHAVAASHGLANSAARAWAWPATLDLFIVAGELLMLRASLARTTDWWAIALTVVGSGGSIALNVFGVGGSDPLAYVTAAVPPTAALLAFGALMRQIHALLAEQAETTAATASVPDSSASPEAASPTATAPSASPANATVPATASPLPVAAPETASTPPAASLPMPVVAPPATASEPASPATATAPATAAAPASGSDQRDLDHVADTYRTLAAALGRTPSDARLAEALDVSRSRAQQLRTAAIEAGHADLAKPLRAAS